MPTIGDDGLVRSLRVDLFLDLTLRILSDCLGDQRRSE